MIVKNEEETLPRCLSGLNVVFDEIIIVDTGSGDKTKEIAHNFTPLVYDFTWVDDFSKARNFSFSKATGDYVMWLDADDVITPENLEKLKQLKNKLNGSVDCYMLKYVLSVNEQGEPTFSYYRERIVKNDHTFFWQDPVHEVMTPHGKMEYCDITILHQKQKTSDSDRNLKIYERLLQQNIPLSARQKFYYSRELFYHKKYHEAVQSFEDYLTAYHGWVENKIEACLMLAKCYGFLNDHPGVLRALVQSFTYDAPRAEVLCELGNEFLTQRQPQSAIYWLKLAKKCKPNLKSGAFIMLECYGLIPNLLLCVAHYQLGQINKAKFYNQLAKKSNPQHPSVLHNEQFFNSLKPSN